MTSFPLRIASKLAPFLALGLMLAAAPVAVAQWSSSAAANLSVADRSGEQTQSKIRATSDGGCYISWFDNNAGGYDVYLQRLDGLGNEVWAHNGVLVADRGFSSTQDYDFDVDAEDNAILFFRDDRFGGSRITAQKIDRDGVAQWGATGVQVSPGPSDNQPRGAALSDGSVVVAWTSGSPAAITMQRLDSSGAPQWTAPGVVLVDQASPVRPFNLSDIQAADDGSFIVLWFRCTGSNCITSAKHLYSQKFDGDGQAQWNGGDAPVIVFDLNSIQSGYFPTFVHDGAGGAVYGWYETGGDRKARVQHVSADGVELYGHNGVQASTQAGRIGLSPSFSYEPAGDQIYVFWTETNSVQNAWGVYAQRLAAGVRQWGDNGLELQPLTAMQSSFIRAVGLNAGAMAFYFDRSGASLLKGAAVDAAGNVLWTPAEREIRSVLGDKSRLDAVRSSCGTALLTWGEGAVADRNILAQNVNVNGVLGTDLPSFIPGDIDADFAVTLADFAWFEECMTGPGVPGGPVVVCTGSCVAFDLDGDQDVDAKDAAAFMQLIP